MKKRIIAILAILALISVASAGIGKAHAYFTTYVEAEGKNTVTLGYETEINEQFEDWVKHVTIKNKDDSAQGTYVRATAFCADTYELKISGEGWEKKGDWWYYGEKLEPGDETPPLDVEIHVASTGEKPSETDGNSFNVTVVYEANSLEWETEGE